MISGQLATATHGIGSGHDECHGHDDVGHEGTHATFEPGVGWLEYAEISGRNGHRTSQADEHCMICDGAGAGAGVVSEGSHLRIYASATLERPIALVGVERSACRYRFAPKTSPPV